MLILTRKVGDRIRIGDGIEIAILELKGRSVRIGVSAPKGMSVLREEVYQRIREENVRAAVEGPTPEMLDAIGRRIPPVKKTSN